MIIVDTGFWLALLSQGDAYHEQALKVFKTLEDDLITTWQVMTETCYFLLEREGPKAQTQFLDRLIGGDFQIFETKLDHAPRMSQLMKQYADLPMDLADASLVIVAEHLDEGKILSADQRDFNTYRWKNREPFENLMFPMA